MTSEGNSNTVEVDAKVRVAAATAVGAAREETNVGGDDDHNDNVVSGEEVLQQQQPIISTMTNDSMPINNNNNNDSTTTDPNNLLCYGATCGLVVGIDNPLQKLRQRRDGLLTKFKQQRRQQQLQKLVNNVRAGSSLYDPSLYLCGLPNSAVEEVGGGGMAAGLGNTPGGVGGCGGLDFTFSEEELKDLESYPIPASDLSDPDRTICVITTAAMPWRTGTAVNPLLRALYLVRYQEEERKRRRSDNTTGEMDTNNEKDNNNRRDGSGSGIHGSNDNSAHSDNGNNHSTGSVVLVIPWLDSEEDRIRLYGQENSFSCPDGILADTTKTATINGDTAKNDNNESLPSLSSAAAAAAPNTTASAAAKYGMAQQEAWIRHYSATSCGMPHEASQLQIIFYPAFYLSGFGSIFPKVDLCNYIPEHLVDVAILEEPEHLNWFRMPSYETLGEEGEEEEEEEEEEYDNDLEDGDEEEDMGEMRSDKVEASPQKVEVSLHKHASTSNSDKDPIDTEKEVYDDSDVRGSGDGRNLTDTAAPTTIQRKGSSSISTSNKKDSTIVDEAKKLGWTHRFRFVLGIVHTNYEEYARQYGIGISLIAAPAIGAISALIIRAHCHQVIKLSNTLPNFAPGKEVTCNVHGVRREFLEGVDMSILASSFSSDHQITQHGSNAEGRREAPPSISPVYFIGKLVWAKGFDLMLDLQDIFRRRYGEYFSIDIFGGGPDENAIVRAFHGRHHATPTERPSPIPSAINMTKESSALSLNSSTDEPLKVGEITVLDAAAVLTNPQSIKEQSSQVLAQIKRQSSLLQMDGDDVVSQYLSMGFEVCQIDGSATYVKESRRRLHVPAAPAAQVVADDELTANSNTNPLEILGDLSGKSFDTGIKTGLAVYNIADSSIKNILTMSFSQLKNHPMKTKMKGKEGKSSGGDDNKKQFVFDPPLSRFEWRRRPVPAKFPGVIDHAQLKNMPHKIFLNPSTSEVLCTTTAEALAMNKFVIIPKHPSNDFFVQFKNCLSYETLDECATKMAWALKNTPSRLTESERRQFTWEAATERLMESSVVTVKEARERAENGMDKTDARISFWLSESGEKSSIIRNFFNKNGADRSPKLERQS